MLLKKFQIMTVPKESSIVNSQ